MLVAHKFQKAGLPLPSPGDIEWIIQNARQNNTGIYQPVGGTPATYTPINLLKINNL